MEEIDKLSTAFGSKLESEKWQKVKAVFQASVELPADQREAFLNEACGADADLRREVEALLASDEEAGEFLASPIVDGFALPEIKESFGQLAGRRIGSYEIVRELGRGGMGVVFLAERADSQYSKQVAIKLVRMGTDTEFAAKRFRSERQILATLDHPNIAKMHDGGITEDGRPYLVMEYIEGEPIDLYCDKKRLDLPARLKLFRQVCEAVQHAHQKLIIHRDIKPSNVLVTEEGVPKLLDFGIAKLLDPTVSNEILESTATAMRLMTPEYASPEQVRGDLITAASDVYSLGVLFYKLLTGNPPYHFKNHLPHEILNVVCETEPTRPNLPDSRFSGDLENILLMALRKEPHRRYGSVEQFSEDIRRMLDNLPILAHRDTFLYRSKKFVRRNRIGIAAALLLFISLSTGLAAALWQARIARAERARAEQRFNDVRRLANSYIFEIHAGIRDLPGSTPARKLLVERALEYLNKLAAEGDQDPTLLRELALAYREIGDIQGRPYNPNIGNPSGALQSWRKSVEIFESLAAKEPQNSEIRRDLATGLERLALLLAVEEGEICSNKALTIRESLHNSNPSNIEDVTALADSYRIASIIAFAKGDIAKIDLIMKAQKLLEAVVAAYSSTLEVRLCLARIYEHSGDALMFRIGDKVRNRVGDKELAEKLYRKALDCHIKAAEIFEQLSNEDSVNAQYRRNFGTKTYNVGWAFERLGNLDEALEKADTALAAFERLSSADPANESLKYDRIFVHSLKAEVLKKRGDYAAAIRQYRTMLSIAEASKGADLSDKFLYLRSYFAIGHCLAQTGRLNEALAYFDKALSNIEKMPVKSLEAHTLNVIAERMGGSFDSAKSHSQPDAVRLMNRLSALSRLLGNRPDASLHQLKEAAWTLLKYGTDKERDPETALGFAQRAVELTKEKDPDALNTLSLAYERTGKLEQAVLYKKKTLTTLSEIAAQLNIPNN